MDDERALEILEELCRRLLIAVSYEALESDDLRIQSGGCVVRGEHRIIIERSLPLSRKVQILAEELSRHDLANIYLPPYVRELIEGEGRGTSGLTPDDPAAEG